MELCKDRVGLLMSPDGPRGAQLWNTRSTIMVDMPQADGWPTPLEVLAGAISSLSDHHFLCNSLPSICSTMRILLCLRCACRCYMTHSRVHVDASHMSKACSHRLGDATRAPDHDARHRARLRAFAPDGSLPQCAAAAAAAQHVGRPNIRTIAGRPARDCTAAWPD